MATKFLKLLMSQTLEKLAVVREANDQHDRCAVFILKDRHTAKHKLCKNLGRTKLNGSDWQEIHLSGWVGNLE